MDTNEKKIELFHNGLSIQPQDHLILFPTLSYNALASVVIDQEGNARTFRRWFKRCSTKVSLGLHATYGTTAPSSTVAVG
jgi:hypothetical protein